MWYPTTSSKLIDVGIIPLYCDMTNDYLKRKSNLPLTKLVTLVNEWFVGIPPGAHLPSYHPYYTTKDDSQAGMSGKMRRQTAPFLWCFRMGITYTAPDEDRIVQCGLVLDIVKGFLCDNNDYTEPSLQRWQRYIFEFGHMMETTFDIDVSTKWHRTMRHDSDHIPSVVYFLLIMRRTNGSI